MCEDCLGKAVPWPGIMHGCYRNSRAASSVVALMLSAHRALRTWSRTVTTYVTPTEFSRWKLIEGGLSPARVFVKPNFVRVDPGCGSGDGGYAVFAGRLSAEKGIQTLLDAWAKLAAELPLKIVGDGPLSAQVRAAAAGNTRIEWLGWRPMAEVLSIIGDAAFLVMPSNWYETFGRTIIEAFAKGTPVVASNLGAMAELVADRHTGLLFESADSQDLTRKVRSLLSDPLLRTQLSTGARREYESRYTSEHNYRMLMDIYEHAIVLHRHSLQLKSTG